VDGKDRAMKFGDSVFFARTKLLHQKMTEMMLNQKALLSPKKKEEKKTMY